MGDFVNNIMTVPLQSKQLASGNPSPLETLITLCHHRWNLPIISELHRDNGAKFVTLVNRLSISRDALARTLQALQDAGFVQRNPGYGHPLRPEYILTALGERLGPAVFELVTKLRQEKLEEIAFKKWALPILHALEPKALRFTELRQLPLTARALSLTLKELEQVNLIEESYQLTERGQRIAALVKQMLLNV
jgi:DNA-binding HxlR family transcriptional regulator